MLELVGIAISQKDWVRDDGSGGEDEKKWRDRVAQHFVGERDRAGAEAPMRTAERKNGRGSQTVKNPAYEYYATDKFGEFSGGNQDARPYAERDHSGGRSLKSWVNFRQFFEEEIIVGHGVENARRGKHNAVGGAEGWR